MTEQESAQQQPVVAVVLSGAAARGAFQAGALAELLPVLAEAGLTPSIVLGTSAGAINATLYGAKADLPAERVASELEDVWRRMSNSNVFLPIGLGAIRPAIQFTSGFVLGLGRGTTSLLDTLPLHVTARRELDTRRLHANIADDSPVSTVGVIATRVPPAAPDTFDGTSSARTVLFLDERTPSHYTGDTTRAISVAHGRLLAEHVIASAAIPVAFPPQRVTEPPEEEGWYIDGGVRLNAPLKPAIDLGATHIIVISATSIGYGPQSPPDLGRTAPDTADTGAQVLNAVLADRLTEDVIAIERTNRLVRHNDELGVEPPPRRTGTAPYREVKFATITPQPGEMGRLASCVHRKRTTGWRAGLELDNRLLGRAFRGLGDSAGRRELLSYLFFDEDYFAESISVGRRAAREALAGGWRTEPGRTNTPIGPEPPRRDPLRVVG